MTGVPCLTQAIQLMSIGAIRRLFACIVSIHATPINGLKAVFEDDQRL